MKKIFIILAILVTGILAEEDFSYKPHLGVYLEKLFYSRLSKYDTTTYKKYFKDKTLKKAIAYMQDPKYFKQITIIDGDPEEGIKLKKEKIKVPNYKEILQILYKAAKNDNNPVAAFYGLYIINNVFAENKPIYYLMKREFSKVLYNNSENCDGYLYYGKYLMNGIGGERKIVKAFEVFKKGYDKCLNKEYYKLLLQNYMNILQRKIENAK